MSEPGTLDSRLERSAAVCLGEVQGMTSYRRSSDAAIVTAYSIAVIQGFSGVFPRVVEVVQRGGQVGDVATWPHHLSADLVLGKTYLLFLERRGDQTLGIVDGPLGAVGGGKVDPFFLRRVTNRIAELKHVGEDVSDRPGATAAFAPKEVTGNGLSSTPRRFLAQDRGEPIPVLADVSTLPAGISVSQALDALDAALRAWEAELPIRFYLEGTTTFAQSAENISDSDGKLRVQMHDNFGSISDQSTTLGIGGGYFTSSSGTGGIVNGVSFRRSVNGYVVLNHPKSALTDPTTLEEVLAHEIGHVIGLAHSSETSPEPNADLAQALMYFRAHGDGRGAQLASWDRTASLLAYPNDNLPPAGLLRRFTAVTYSPSLATPRVNEFQVHDLDGDSVSLSIAFQENINGVFSVNGNRVTYTPNGAFGDVQIGDPENSFFDRAIINASDGEHTGVVELRVIGFARDRYPSPAADGLPDAWMTANFGASVPVPGVSGAGDDPDGDNLTNLEEFELGTDPNDANSLLEVDTFILGGDGSGRSLSWTSAEDELYQIEFSTDLFNWNPVRYVSGTGSLTTTEALPEPAGELGFYRVSRLE